MRASDVLMLAAFALAWTSARWLPAPRAAAQADEEIEVVIAHGQAALAALLAPEAGATTVCEGATCPSGVSRVVAEDVRFSAHGARAVLSARLRVTAHVPLLGARVLQSRVRCEGEPRVDRDGALRAHDVDCDVTDVPGLGAALGAAVARSIESRSIDLGAQARDGMLARHSADPRLASPCAARCVVGVALVTPIERGGDVRIALRVTVRPRRTCCP